MRKRALQAVRSLFNPLLPDDYIELINPLWSTRELRGRIERIEKETEDAVTISIKPGWEWPGHEPGQYLRVGVIVDGVHHWRAYSITSDPGHPEGWISITPKLVEEGTVTPELVRKIRPGSIVRLGGVEGDFKLPDPLPDKLLFISAGSGITPIMSMLRHLSRCDEMNDVMIVHSAHEEKDVIFGDQLKKLDDKHDGLKVHIQQTGTDGRIEPRHLDDLCPDWKDRITYISGPSDMLDAMIEHWEEHCDKDRLKLERFQPKLDGGGEEGEGGKIVFRESDEETECDGGTPILVAGEEAGLELPYGCREGVCHTCVGTLCSGKVRDLRNGNVHGSDGETIRTCINAPEGDIEIAL